MVEVGLGGTWDSTNVADAKVAVITPIGIDHTEYLGATLNEIAGNKAGIVKADSVAVVGPQEPDAMNAILRRTVEVDASVARFGSEFAVLDRSFAVGGQRLTLQGLGGVYEDIFLPLAGEHQATNAALALAAVEVFFGAGATRQLDLGPVQDGFAAVASPGRLERVRTSPTILVDAAHNPHGAAALAAALAAEFSFTRLVGVLAVMADKDVRGILEALADTFDEVVVTRNSSPRSMPPAELAELAEDSARNACGRSSPAAHKTRAAAACPRPAACHPLRAVGNNGCRSHRERSTGRTSAAAAGLPRDRIRQ